MPRMSLMTDCGLAWTLSSMIDSIRVRIFSSIMFSTSASIFFSTFARGSDYPIFVTINDFLPIRSTRDVIECKIWIDYWLLSSASCVMLRTYDGFWLCPLKFFSYFSLMSMPSLNFSVIHTKKHFSSMSSEVFPLPQVGHRDNGLRCSFENYCIEF